MVQTLGHYDGMNKNDWKHLGCIWRRMERVKWTDKIKKCSARKSGRRKNNAGTNKEEGKKLAGPLAKKELPAEICLRRNGKREECSRQKKILDYR